MAEFLIIGPLVNFGLFLTTWALHKRKANRIRKENVRETMELVSAVNSLGVFMQDKATAIAEFERTFGIRPSSLDSLRVEIPTICTEAQATLDDDRLSDEIKRLRIGNIHNRLTQTLLLHIGVIIVEGLTANMCVAQENLRRTERLEHRLYGMEEARGLYPGEYPILDLSLQNTVYPPVARAAQTLTWNGGTEKLPSPQPYRDAPSDKAKNAKPKKLRRAIVPPPPEISRNLTNSLENPSPFRVKSCNVRKIDIVRSGSARQPGSLMIEPAIKGIEMTAELLFYGIITLMVFLWLVGA